MDYDKTVTLYEKTGLLKKWKENPESYLHNAEKVWYDKVKSKRTGEFWQAEDLIKRELYHQIGNHPTPMEKVSQ